MRTMLMNTPDFQRERPAQHLDDIEHAGVAGACKLFAAHAGQVRVAEHVQPMVHADEDDVAATREICAVV